MSVAIETSAKPKSFPVLRLAWKHGGSWERFFVAYFVAYPAAGSLGFLTLCFLTLAMQAPFEMVASYAYAFTFGAVGLWPLWHMASVLYVPVLAAIIHHPNMDNIRRPLLEALLSYGERYGVRGRFPEVFTPALFLALVNAALLPLSLVVVEILGYSTVPGKVSLTVLYSAAWIFPTYIALLAISIRTQNRFARAAESRGYPVRSLARFTGETILSMKRGGSPGQQR